MNLYTYEVPIDGLWSNHMHLVVLADSEEDATKFIKDYGIKYMRGTVFETMVLVETIDTPGVIYFDTYEERIVDGKNVVMCPVYKHGEGTI